MANMPSCTRLSARLASQCASRHAARRAFSASVRERAAQNYNMPALSPTMTEGNIASWRLKEGDSFTAGDVILEIETDKASMDVEAQDDGILFKIMQGDGAKQIKVGQRIAVLAEEGDDLSSLEVPAEEKAASSEGKKDESAAPKKEEKKSEKQASAPPTKQEASSTSKSSEKSRAAQGGKAQQQKYPLFPSVQQLLHENGMSKADADKIPSTGPNGRLLKGDVLAYLDKIPRDYPQQSSERLHKLSHLDLSNIQLAKPSAAPAEAKKQTSAASARPEPPKPISLALPISLTAVLATQKRVQESLGITLPLSTFVARASELANDELPLPSGRPPTAEDLFNSVLGLDRVSPRTSRGNFVPQVTGLAPSSVPLVASRAGGKVDIIDVLAGKKSAPKAVKVAAGAQGVAVGGQNVFSVVARPGEEKRAMEYLERMKLALEMEPGRLVL